MSQSHPIANGQSYQYNYNQSNSINNQISMQNVHWDWQDPTQYQFSLW